MVTMPPSRIAVAVETAAPAETLFATLVDWPRHSEWMFLTSAVVESGDGRSAGSTLAAFTGVGRVGFLDTMEITEWRAPEFVSVTHTGLFVRGTGWFRITPTPGGSRIVWAEELELPLGALGRFGWLFVKPPVAFFLRRSLRKLGQTALRTARR
jgi:uncharacterized protein YndB with AHSA1/START domain